MRSVYKSKPTVFLHADNHFSAKIVKKKKIGRALVVIFLS